MQRPFDIDAELFPFTSRWMEVDGIPIHYLDEGQGAPLLLLHGNFMWSFSYRRLINALSSDYRCVSIDLAGMGMSGKPHRFNGIDFGYTYAEQKDIVKQIISKLDLQDITFLSFDHGGPVGFGAMTESKDRFKRIVIANSWAWSCHEFRATNIWSKVAPVSRHFLRWLITNKKRWLFEAPQDLQDSRVWDACTMPYANAADFKPMATLASQLTRARSYFDEVAAGLPDLSDLQIDIVWASRHGGLFPEFVEEDAFLARWREMYPQASVTLLPDQFYYPLVTRPSNEFLGIIRNQ